ncbi:MAG TPA: NfeD family protein [Thermoleophilaceae bacterium]|nr:NfeD family protein [Thermoleophilaceae bacterium]
MPDWVFWLIAAAVLAAGEVATLGFFLGAVSLAALPAALVAAAGGSLTLQLIVFILASLGSLAFIRPVARRHLNTPASIRTGTAALIGARATVIERVHVGGGTVKIGGEEWSARPYDEDEVYDEGARVEVLKIEGATALVSD